MTINACVLEVDTGGAISTDNELQLVKEESDPVSQVEVCKYLVVPAVGASSNLDPIGQAVSTAQEVGTKFGDVIGGSIIQAYDE